jgi:hypothetical protein
MTGGAHLSAINLLQSDTSAGQAFSIASAAFTKLLQRVTQYNCQQHVVGNQGRG